MVWSFLFKDSRFYKCWSDLLWLFKENWKIWDDWIIEIFDIPLPKEGILKHNEFSIPIKLKEDKKVLWKINFKIKPKIESDLHISLTWKKVTDNERIMCGNKPKKYNDTAKKTTKKEY